MRTSGQKSVSACTIATAAALALAPGAAPADELPLGHKNFYPSPGRPVGHRGDGNGAYPGATPVTNWTEGTPERKKLKRPGEQPQEVWDLADRNSKNICWRTPIRGFGNSHPIIVGDRVITTADPYWLVCADAHTGKILWQRATSPFEMQGLSEEDVDQLDLFVDMAYAARAPIPTMVGNYTRLGSFTEKVRGNWMRMFGMCVPVVRKMVAENRYGARAVPALEVMEHALAAIDQSKEGQEGKSVAGIVGKIMWQGALNTEPPSWATWVRLTYKLFAYVHWDGWTGFTFASPVSDGEHVYQWIGQGQIACYDLAGNRKWGIHYPYDPPGQHNRGDGIPHLPSPLLVGDVFVVQTIHHLVGVDKHTGRVIWHVPNSTHHFSVGTHKHLRLPNGTDVVVCTGGKIVRAHDGRVLGDLGVKHDTGPVTGGESMVGIGSRVFFPAQRTGKVIAFDVGPDEDDKVSFKEAWSQKGGSVNTSSIVCGDRYFRFGKTGDVINWQTGKMLPGKINFTIRSGAVGPTLAGNHVIWYESGTAYGRKRRDLRMVSNCELLELLDGGGAKALESTNLLDGSQRPDMVRLKTHNPQFWDAKRWDPQGAVPGQFAHGGFCAQGNRVFLRALSALYCLGDPATGYDWDPSTRPKEVTELMEKSVVPDTPEGYVKRLQMPYRWEREQAVAGIARLSLEEQATIAGDIAKLLTSKSWFATKAAGSALQRMVSTAASVAPQVVQALGAALEAGHLMRGVLLTETLMAVAPDRTDGVAEEIGALLKSADAQKLTAACRVVGRLGERGSGFAADLAALLEAKDVHVATEAARATARIGPSAGPAATALGAALAKKDDLLTEACLCALKALGENAAPSAPAVAGVLSHKNPHRAREAAELLGSLGPQAATALDSLLDALKRPDPMVAAASAEALLGIDPNIERKIITVLCKQLKSPDDDRVFSAARAARVVRPHLKIAKSRSQLVTALADILEPAGKGSATVAAITLGEFGSLARPAIPHLHEAGLNVKIKQIARDALKKIDPSIDVDKLQPKMGGDDDDDDLELDL